MASVIDSYTSTPNGAYQISGGSGTTAEAAGQSFTTTAAYQVSQIDLLLYKEGSPADNLVVEIVSTSINGTVLATSSATLGSVLGTATTGTFLSFIFPSPPSLANATKYYLRLSRTGANDNVNRYDWCRDNINGYPNGGGYGKDGGTWSAEHGFNDCMFKVYNNPKTVFGNYGKYVSVADGMSRAEVAN